MPPAAASGASQGFRRVGPGGVPELWPGPIALRPLGFGEILETALAVLRFNPRTIFGLTFVVFAVTMLVSLIVILPFFAGTLSEFSGNTNSGSSLLVDATNAVSGLVTFLLSGVLMVTIAESALGRKLDAKQSWARVKGRVLALIGYFILVTVGLILMIAPVGAGAVAAFVNESYGLGLTILLLGGLLTLALIIWVAVSISLAPAIIVLERLGPIAAMKRSHALLKGGWWRAFGLQLLVMILTGFVGAILMIPIVGIFAGVMIGVVGLDSEPNPGAVIIAAVIGALMISAASVLINTLVRPYSSAVIGLIYLDRRFRTEALAVDLLAEAERDARR